MSDLISMSMSKGKDRRNLLPCTRIVRTSRQRSYNQGSYCFLCFFERTDKSYIKRTGLKKVVGGTNSGASAQFVGTFQLGSVEGVLLSVARLELAAAELDGCLPGENSAVFGFSVDLNTGEP